MRKTLIKITCICLSLAYILGMSGGVSSVISSALRPLSSFRCEGNGCACDQAGYELIGCACFSESEKESSCCDSDKENTEQVQGPTIDKAGCGSPPDQVLAKLPKHTTFVFAPKEKINKLLYHQSAWQSPIYTSPLPYPPGKIPIAA